MRLPHKQTFDGVLDELERAERKRNLVVYRSRLNVRLLSQCHWHCALQAFRFIVHLLPFLIKRRENELKFRLPSFRVTRIGCMPMRRLAKIVPIPARPSGRSLTGRQQPQLQTAE